MKRCLVYFQVVYSNTWRVASNMVMPNTVQQGIVYLALWDTQASIHAQPTCCRVALSLFENEIVSVA